MKNDQEKYELVLVFRTNLTYKKDVRRISALFKTQEGIVNWNVDLADSDRVLRIESMQMPANKIITLVTAAGYNCEELMD